MATRYLLRRDTAADWADANPILAQGEPGVETDTKRFKIGDGVSAWASLPYAADALGSAAAAQAAAQAYSDGKFLPTASLDTATAAVVTPGGSATAAAIAADPALRAAYGLSRAPLGTSCAVIGSSIVANGGTPDTGFLYARGFWVTANVMLGHRLDYTLVDGQAGTSVTDAGWAARATAAVAGSPTWVLTEMGLTNSIAGGQTLTAIQAAVTATLDTWKAVGARTILLTCPPRIDFTTDQRTVQAQLNTWLRGLPALRGDVVVADVAPYVSDPANGVPAHWIPAMTDDGIHPNSYGCQQFARPIFDALDGKLAPASLLAPVSDAGNLMPYAIASFAGGDVGAPTYWIASVTGTAPAWSHVARDDGIPGVWQRVVVPDGSGVRLQFGVPGWAQGDNLVGYAEFRTSNFDSAPAGNTQRMSLYVEAFDTGFAIQSMGSDLYADPGFSNTPPLAAGILQTQAFPVYGTTNQVDFFLDLQGGATYDVGRVGVIRV